MEFVNGKDDIPYMKWKITCSIELDDGTILTGKPDQIVTTMVSGFDFPQQTNPVILTFFCRFLLLVNDHWKKLQFLDDI